MIQNCSSFVDIVSLSVKKNYIEKDYFIFIGDNPRIFPGTKRNEYNLPNINKIIFCYTKGLPPP